MVTMFVDPCWNRIGVAGDGSCIELKSHIHCRNCPVFSGAGRQLLDCPAPQGYTTDWTNLLAHEKEDLSTGKNSAVLFRLGLEWLALPAPTFKEVMPVRVIHRLPHRNNAILLGVVNVRGEIHLCLSLKAILGIEDESPDEVSAKGDSSSDNKRLSHRRMVTVARERDQWVVPVDEIHGVHRFDHSELGKVPATVSKAPVKFICGMLSWQGKSVGVLDDELLFYTMSNRLDIKQSD